MVYNPIFEEETERREELKALKDTIRSRAAKNQIVELGKKLLYFGKAHPIATFTTLVGILGFGISGKKR